MAIILAIIFELQRFGPAFREVGLLGCRSKPAQFGRRAARGRVSLVASAAHGTAGSLTSHNARRGSDWKALRETIGRLDLRIQDLRHTFVT